MLAKFSALLAEPSEQLTFGGRNIKEITSRVLPKSSMEKRPMLTNIDTLTELFYRYIKVMRPEDTEAINLALVDLRNRIDVLEKPVQLAMKGESGTCTKCGALLSVSAA